VGPIVGKALALAFLLLLGGAAWAKEAAPAAADPALELRVMAIAAELRCLVCQNQTIADSDADLAKDLRNQIREKLQQGQSGRDIIDYMVARYGDFVLWRPPFKPITLLLWLGPVLLLAAGLLALLYLLVRQRDAREVELSEADRARAVLLLDTPEEMEER
jgi:cytochrome c-type biogenesis protein CcmH